MRVSGQRRSAAARPTGPCLTTAPCRDGIAPTQTRRPGGSQIGSVLIDGPDAARVEFKADIFKTDLVPAAQRDQRLAALEGNGLTGRRHNADHVFMDKQARVHIPYREDRAIGIARVAEIGIAPRRQILGKHRRLRARSLPCTPFRGHNTGLFQPHTTRGERPCHSRPKERVEHRIGGQIIHDLVRPDQKPGWRFHNG